MRIAISIAITTLVIGCVDNEDESDSVSSDLTASQRRTRSERIRDVAAHAGLTNGALLAGIGQVETGLAHCWSEATWACQGPASSSCGGGPVIAGAGDGPCSAHQGGLGMFQFDGGTYSQTLARDGVGILKLDGNIAHAIDFLVGIVIREVSGVSTRAQAIAWMNGIPISNSSARFNQWGAILACRYNGACGSASQAKKYKDATIKLHGELGGGFWDAAGSPVEVYVLMGDWDGNGTKTPGFYNARTHEWSLSNFNAGHGVDLRFGWGGDDQLPVVGDWDGDGTDTPGLYNPVTHVWGLSNHNSGGGVDYKFGWGGDGGVPIAGDWDGDGRDGVGLFYPATSIWGLSNHLSGGGTDYHFGWGGGGQVPLVGDWNGDGTETPGFYDKDTHIWSLSDFNAAHGVDHRFGWGGGDRLPIVGDWNGDGTDTPGLFNADTRGFGLSNVNAGGGVAYEFGWGGAADYGVVGDVR